MSSRRVEAYRRTTKRLLANERQFAATKTFLATCSPLRKAETAAWLLALVATDLDGADEFNAANATKLARFTKEFSDAISQRAMAGASSGEIAPRVMETPPAASVPPTVPPVSISPKRS